MNPYTQVRLHILNGISYPQGTDAALDAVLRYAEAAYSSGYTGPNRTDAITRFVIDDVAAFLGADHNFARLVAERLNTLAQR